MDQSKVTILVCDDETAIRSIVATKLRSVGFEVIEARNGLEGYCCCDHSAALPGTLPRTQVPLVPSLVVTDLQMPMMTGIEMAMSLKKFGPTSHVPVLMLTARGYIAEQDQIALTNIRVFMSKPFGTSQLLENIRGLLSNEGMNGSLQIPPSPPQNQAKAA